MNFDHLLRQGRELAELDPKRPRQANLRRAISSAYYGIFHFLVGEATDLVFGKSSSQAPLRAALARAFSHSTMAEVCKSFSIDPTKSEQSQRIYLPLGGSRQSPIQIRDEIGDLSKLFARLQDHRHRADYDWTARFIRASVIAEIEDAVEAREKFATQPDDDQRRFFLVCLLAWKEMTGRR